MSELWQMLPVLLGGVLALAGSYISQREAARARAVEAKRERIERFRPQISCVVREVDVALRRIAELAAPTPRPPDRLDSLLDDLSDQCNATNRTIKQALVSQPAGTPDSLGKAFDGVAALLDEARELTTQFAIAYSTESKTPRESGIVEAEEALVAARHRLDGLVELARGPLD